MNLGSLGQDSIAKYGEHDSFYFEGRWYTNVEMELNANRLGNALKSLGIRRGDRVAIQMPNSPLVLWSFPAIYKIGAVAVPMNPLYFPELRCKSGSNEPRICPLGTGSPQAIKRIKSCNRY
jgi:acyl-CoA synthetase (AMP-forming)/AMP-acid ligase II